MEWIAVVLYFSFGAVVSFITIRAVACPFTGEIDRTGAIICLVGFVAWPLLILATLIKSIFVD
jgi:hypothetical protein